MTVGIGKEGTGGGVCTLYRWESSNCVAASVVRERISSAFC